MGSEVLLYGYAFVCMGMIVFNVLHSLILKGREKTFKKKGRRLKLRMKEQLGRLERGLKVESRHKRYLSRKLLRVTNLIAFERMLESASREADALTDKYLLELYPVFLSLAVAYQKKETMQTAYFAFFTGRHGVRRQACFDSLMDMMAEYVRKDNLYCRLNALEALYLLGSPKHVVRAVRILNEADVYFNEKLLTDGLLSYKGSHEALIELLLESFPRFSVKIRLSVLNYIRYCSGNYSGRIFDILTDECTDKELRISAIRYFGRYPFLPAREALLSFLADETPKNWEYAAASATALGRYPGEEVLKALLCALQSRNWFVRYNAALSVEMHAPEDSIWLEVMDGADRFAREMAVYRLEVHRAKEAERGSVG